MTRPGVHLEIGPKYEAGAIALDKTSLRLRYSQPAVALPAAPSDLDVNPVNPPAGSDPWEHIGGLLASRLRQNPAVDSALDACLASHPGDSRPIRLEIDHSGAAALPWEVLFDSHTQFLALDARWPVVRLINPQEIRRSINPGEIRIAVVLSALRREGRQQWDAILDLVKDYRATTSLGLRLQAFVSEPDLLSRIRAEVDTLGSRETWLSVSTVTPSLLQDIGRFQPHLLHFFSHGSLSSGSWQLELAQTSDWASPQSASSIFIDTSALAHQLAGTEIWLCTLNACKGGNATADAQAMAADLVRAGVPAAIGMRQVIDKLDADTFCEAIFAEALKAISDVVAAGGGEISFPRLISEPRRQLRKRPTDPSASWSLPVLFIRAEPLVVEVVEHIDEEREASTDAFLRGLREVLEPADAGEMLLSDIDSEI